jgi:hypothetical protein
VQKTVHLGLCSFVFGLGCLALSTAAFAQAAPDEAHAYAEGPTSVAIEFTACRTSDEPNCYLEFSIYRNPPGFTQAPVWDSLIGNADQASHTIYDTKVQPGQTYSYQVCAAGLANSDRSNCITTNSVKTPLPPPPPGNGNGNGNGNNNCCSKWAPPQNLQILAGTSSISLAWTNPPNEPNPPDVIAIYRNNGSGFWEELKQLDVAGNKFTLNTKYVDSDGLLPHSTYGYAICEGIHAPVWNNCADSRYVVTWGVDPILAATRTGPASVKLSVAVDNMFALGRIGVTRQGSDDPCRQGTTLGNGAQGCRTQTYGANGVPQNAPNIVTVYEQTNAFGSNSGGAPWVIDGPDDTAVQPNVEYYYQAQVTWGGSVEQNSTVVTVPTWNRFIVPGKAKVPNGMIKPIKPPPNVPHAPTRPLAARTVAPISRSAAMRITGLSLDAAISNAKQKPGDAQALYTLGQAYCGRRMRGPCVSVMYMGLLQAQRAGNSALSAQITNSLSQQGVTLGQ